MEVGFLSRPLFYSLPLLASLVFLQDFISGLSYSAVAAASVNPNPVPSISVLGKLTSYFNLTCGQIPTKSPNLQYTNSSGVFAPFLVSKESSFAWGFISSTNQVSPPTCSLSVVCYNCKSYYVTWSACCDGHGQSFSNATTLKLGTQRDLQLVDSQGIILWSSNSTNTASIELLETGNLLLLNSQNSISWQSFHYPSNVLLPGQILTSGMSLTAGDYSASMEPGGLALRVKLSEESLPYLVLNASWGLSNMNTIMNPVCSGLSLAYAADGSTLMMEINLGSKGSPCYNASVGNTMMRFNQTTSTASSGFKYLQLDDHGGLQTFVDGALEFSWFDQGDSDEGRGYCNLPSHCGEFGICAPGGQCRCPHGLITDTDDYLMATDYSIATPDMDDCPQIQAANCSTGMNFKVLKLQDLEYFPHRYMPTPMKNFSLQVCVDSCMHNCSCVIAFYNSRTLGCHHYSRALSMQRTTYGGEYLAFIKMSIPLDDTENQLSSRSTAANHSLNIIAISIIFGTSLVVCLIVFMYVYRHYGTWNDEDSSNGARIRRTDDDVFLDSLSGLPPRYTFKEMQHLTNGFSVKLGHGSFGSVYEGTLDDGSRIAVKRLEGTRQGDKEFRAEVASLAGISHVNLVRLRGFCAEGGHRMLVYEYMTNGSLDKWLARGVDGANSAGLQLDWQQRLKIATDAARGLAYLHTESRERIFHLDIKPQNILLDENFAAKLSDFGLSKQLDRARSRTVTSMRGTPGYLAPEWLLQTAVSEKSDVYSFGMVLLELVSGRRNVDYSSVNPDKWFWPAWVVNKAVFHQWSDIRNELSSKGWPLPVHEGEKAIKVAFWCLQEDPKSRPSMATVLLMLEGLVHVADPPLEMSLTLEAQARLLASFHPDHRSSPSPAPLGILALPECFFNSWSFGTSKIPTSAPLPSSPPSPWFKPSLSI